MKKIKTYVLTVSRTFSTKHKRVGEETLFIEKILSGEKIHTIRANYPIWEKRIEEIQKGDAILSLRYWSGKPYNSKQVEFMQLDKDSGIGVQEIEITYNHSSIFVIFKDKRQPSVLIQELKSGYVHPYILELANNDGLSLEDFKEWFRKYDLSKPMAIIHFTKFRY